MKVTVVMNTTYGQYAMNEWWFRHVHVKTTRHKRNVWLVDQIMNSFQKDTFHTTPFQYNKGIMRGCGCNILAG